MSKQKTIKTWIDQVKIIGSVKTGFILFYKNVPVFTGGMAELQSALKSLGLEIEGGIQ